MSMEVPLLNCLVRVVSLFCFDFLLYSWITCMRCGGGGIEGEIQMCCLIFFCYLFLLMALC